jgi:hypothetical protein
MGTLRFEARESKVLTREQYDENLAVLRQAQQASDNHHVFWDLEDDENSTKVKKGFMFVANKIGMDVTIRRVRGSNSLAFYFKKGAHAATSSRMSAAESRERIIKCLEQAGQPLKKNDIIRETGVSPSTWNIRIKDLLAEGIVHRAGDRRDTAYSLGSN